MTGEVGGRAVITCERCGVRMDLGPVRPVQARPRRYPSGWVKVGENRHVCPLCAPRSALGAIRRFS